MLATLDANGLATIISAIGIIAIQLYTLYLKHISDLEKLKRDEAVDAKLAENTKLTADVADNIEMIHKATNSMKDELVKVTGAEGLARGVMEERARADARDAAAASITTTN